MSNFIHRESLSKQVSDEIEHMIESGRYAVGEKIPTEPELMKMFGVSRNTVREAIRGLTLTGLLEVKQGSGTFVRSDNRLQANLEEKYESLSLSDIREARNCIEVTVTRLAALRCNKSDCRKITAAFKKRQDGASDIQKSTLADIDFHVAIAESCHNTILIDLYKSILSYLESDIVKFSRCHASEREKINMLHEELFNAVLEKNPERATRIANAIVNF